MRLNINSSAVVGFTNKLEKLHRSALPSAVRGALNKCAYDVKTVTMPEKAASSFIKREPNFFKANSKFLYATGFNVNTMISTVGFVSTNLKGANNYSVKDLEQQENGGVIDKRAFVPLEGARKGNNMNTSVKANLRLRKIRNIVNPRNAKAKNAKEAFVKSVVFAGKGGFVLGDMNGKQVLWRINSLNKTDTGHFKLTAMYSYHEGRKIKVRGTLFMRNASMLTAKKMSKFYIDEAQRQIHKLSGGHH